MSLKILLGACLLAEASANFVSPGLGKCLDLQAELKVDGTRESLDEMEHDAKTNVQLYECHGDHNQRYEFIYGQFRSWSMKAGDDRDKSFCLTAAAIEDNADVHLELCEEGNEKQQWDLTGDGNVKVAGSNECLDVKAALKEDGTRETWDEIKEHKTVNVHLYKCHNPETTERVNQLWGWTPWKKGKLLNADIVQEEEVASKYSMEYASIGAARGVLPGLCAVSFAAAVVAGAVLGLQRWRQANSPNLQLIPAEE